MHLRAAALVVAITLPACLPPQRPRSAQMRQSELEASRRASPEPAPAEPPPPPPPPPTSPGRLRVLP